MPILARRAISPEILALALAGMAVSTLPGAARAGDSAPLVDPAAPASAAPDPAAPAPASAPVDDTAGETLVVPPMPAADADFSVDRDLFKEEVTDPERNRKAEELAADRPSRDGRKLYQRWPNLTRGTQAVGGLFGAAVVGLLGGSIGQAVDPGDRRFALGGAHGPLFGGLTGTIVGAIGGVWGSGLLFEKDPAPGWTALGGGIGTVVGAGSAAGFALGMGKSDASMSLAVGSFLLFQIGGAVLFNDLFAEHGQPRAGRPARLDGAAPLPTHTPSGGDDTEGRLMFPLALGSF